MVRNCNITRNLGCCKAKDATIKELRDKSALFFLSQCNNCNYDLFESKHHLSLIVSNMKDRLKRHIIQDVNVERRESWLLKAEIRIKTL
jgi:hypothetical protein